MLHSYNDDLRQIPLGRSQLFPVGDGLAGDFTSSFVDFCGNSVKTMDQWIGGNIHFFESHQSIPIGSMCGIYANKTGIYKWQILPYMAYIHGSVMGLTRGSNYAAFSGFHWLTTRPWSSNMAGACHSFQMM